MVGAEETWGLQPDNDTTVMEGKGVVALLASRVARYFFSANARLLLKKRRMDIQLSAVRALRRGGMNAGLGANICAQQM